MRDDYTSAAWADHHGELSAAIHKAVKTVTDGLNWLNAYQFDAPWKRDATDRQARARRT